MPRGWGAVVECRRLGHEQSHHAIGAYDSVHNNHARGAQASTQTGQRRLGRKRGDVADRMCIKRWGNARHKSSNTASRGWLDTLRDMSIVETYDT